MHAMCKYTMYISNHISLHHRYQTATEGGEMQTKNAILDGMTVL